MKQKVIIRNNNLLFQFSDHNNNLHDCSKTMENYALGHYSWLKAQPLSYVSFHVASIFPIILM